MNRFLVLILVVFSLNCKGQLTKDSLSQVSFENQYGIWSSYDTDHSERNQAFVKLNEFAENGNFYAMEFLACHYLSLKGKENLDLINKGLEYAKKVTDNGSDYVNVCLAEYYYRNKDLIQYVETLQFSENSSAKAEFGHFLLFGKSLYFNNGKNENDYYPDYIDTEKGLTLLHEAVNKEILDACYVLGRMYFNGEVVNKDLKQAKKYFLKCENHPDFYQCYFSDEVLNYLDSFPEQ